MWLENAKEILISYISVQLFPRNKTKQKHTFANVLKETSGVPRPGTKVSSQSENMGVFLAIVFLPGGCKMCIALKENTHCFMPLCGFQVQTLLKKCEH